MENARLDAQVEKARQDIIRVIEEVGKRIVGQHDMLRGLMTGLVAGGHVLLEGVPGLAKTLSVKTLAEVMNAEFKRIQFTPDLLPADIVGTMIYRQQTGEFFPRKGPVFANIVLADEINRAPAKVQSALLEAMEEGHVTLGENTYYLPKPFFVLATQNPIETEGTYQLPEAQLDRFLLKINITYASPTEELAILRRVGNEKHIFVEKVVTPELLEQIRKAAESVRVDERIERYIVSIVSASREKYSAEYPYARFISFGASHRGTLSLFRCAKVNALMEGRSYVIPEDVKAVVFNVLRHRIILSYEAESEELGSDDVINLILRAVPVP